MTSGWTAPERRMLQAGARNDEALRCPRCGAAVARHEVPPKAELPYVRRRVLLICTACKRSAAVDL